MTSKIDTTSNQDLLAKPGDAGYIEATASYNLDITIDPQFAVTVTTVSQIQDVLVTARNLGIGVRVHSTGHEADSGAPFTDEVLVKTRLDGAVVIDPDAATATFPAGTLWSEILAASVPHGLVPLSGSAGTVSAIGYLLGGGIGFYGRQYGVASNSIVSIDIVLADGSLVTVDRTNDPELFFALRGGGGGFGIVVSATISLFPVASVATGVTFWSGKDAAYLLEAWER